jgi:hypothetical protein
MLAQRIGDSLLLGVFQSQLRLHAYEIGIHSVPCVFKSFDMSSRRIDLFMQIEY